MSEGIQNSENPIQYLKTNDNFSTPLYMFFILFLTFYNINFDSLMHSRETLR